MTSHRIHVSAEREYDVVIGRGVLSELHSLLEGSTRIAIVHAPTLSERAAALEAMLSVEGYEILGIQLPDAEAAKTSEVLAQCWAQLGAAGFTRNDTIVSLGGGATTDLAGFAAATWLRGIPLVHVPTTVLGMVDAAVGGKTGINTSAGKNLVGSFYSPVGVICDVDLLETLDQSDINAGLAEVVKVGFTSDPEILRIVQADLAAATDPSSDVMIELIARAVQVKATVVGSDFREVRAGSALGREVLNYGHTLGHAVEHLEQYAWRHGAAISVGMCFVAELARLGGRLNPADAALHFQILGSLGLPTSYPAGLWPELIKAMSLDKKARGSVIRFVVLDGIGSPVSWDGPEEQLLEAAYAAIAR
ncbi:MAG: 3-dehydroquinate synthase [Actinomycetota bacterium]|nr:3-dehydroquinate synthase [Actinomycetota bacterium]MDP2288527.1 3-dehydroquinate synthase [Actinomycetota bacterium]